MSRPVQSWKKVRSPELVAFDKSLSTISESNFEGNVGKIINLIVLDEPDKTETQVNDRERMLPFADSLIKSVYSVNVDNYISIELFANFFAELVRKWRGRQGGAFLSAFIMKCEETLKEYIETVIPEDEESEVKVVRKCANVITFLFFAYQYENFNIYPIQIPLKALHMMMKNDVKYFKVIFPFLISNKIDTIMENVVFNKITRGFIVKNFTEWMPSMNGIHKFRAKSVIEKLS